MFCTYKGGTPQTCCDYNQLQTLDSNLDLPRQFFLRCPSCFSNFVELFCQLTCNPVQSNYLSINETGPGDNGTLVIDTLDVVMSKDFANGLFNSCKDVQYPGNNQKAISLFCGRSAEECTPHSWLTYMGDKNNGKTPFQMNYFLTNNPFVVNATGEVKYPMNASIVPCSQAIDNESMACSCLDCEASCSPAPPPVPPPQPWLIFGVDAMWFIMVCAYIGFLGLFLPLIIISMLRGEGTVRRSRKQSVLRCCADSNESYRVEEEKTTCMEELSAR